MKRWLSRHSSTIFVTVWLGSGSPKEGKGINGQSGTVEDIIKTCDIIKCIDGFRLNLASIRQNHPFFHDVIHISCPLILGGDSSSSVVFSSLKNWDWTGTSSVSGSVASLSFPVLNDFAGDTLEFGPSTSLPTISFGTGSRKSLKVLRLCDVPHFQEKTLAGLVPGSTIRECHSIEEKKENKPSSWWVTPLIVVGSLLGVASQLLLVFFFRRRIIIGCYYLIEKIRELLEYLEKKMAGRRDAVACQASAGEGILSSPSLAALLSVPASSLQKGDLLGQGGFGAVFRVSHRHYGEVVAKWFTDPVMEESDMEKGRREIGFGLELKEHPNMVRTLAGIHSVRPE